MTARYRFQQRRAAGWTKPRNSVCVGRGGGNRPFANPYRVGDPGVPDRATAVALYRDWVTLTYPTTAQLADWLAPLRTYAALGCWCPIGEPCHADVLVELLGALDAEGVAQCPRTI